jgi:hypothetical protein
MRLVLLRSFEMRSAEEKNAHLVDKDIWDEAW